MYTGRIFAISAILAAAVSPALADTAPPIPDLNPIRDATEPSAAVEAYARVQSRFGNDPAVELAYIQRMVDFGLPELASSQAQDLIRRNTSSGVPWAVSAFVDAKRDRPGQALWELTTALKNSPDDPFVIRTAGRLIAWYDARVEKSKLLSNVIRDIELARARLAQSPAYTEAYAAAAAGYKSLAEKAPTDAASVPQALSPRYQEPASPPQITYAYTSPEVTNYSIPYTTPYDLSPTYSDTATTYYPGYWWPTYSTFIIGSNDCFRGHHPFDHHRVGSGGQVCLPGQRFAGSPIIVGGKQSTFVESRSSFRSVQVPSPLSTGPTFYTKQSPFITQQSGASSGRLMVAPPAARAVPRPISTGTIGTRGNRR